MKATQQTPEANIFPSSNVLLVMVVAGEKMTIFPDHSWSAVIVSEQINKPLLELFGNRTMGFVSMYAEFCHFVF